MIYIGICIGIAVLFFLYCYWENHRPEVKQVSITLPGQWNTGKGNFCAVIAGDLHNNQYGKNNEKLVNAIKSCHPDAILIPGDLNVNARTDNHVALDFLKQISAMDIPVIMSYGNHESKFLRDNAAAFGEYMDTLKRMNITVLDNGFVDLPCGIRIWGLTFPLDCYRKFGREKHLTRGDMEAVLGTCDKKPGILLAHNPADFKACAEWGADFVVSGHMHGGIVRLPRLGGVISPQWVFFPKYDAGLFEEYGAKLYVTRGLGTHTLPVRVFNRPELTKLTFLTEDNDGNTGKAGSV